MPHKCRGIFSKDYVLSPVFSVSLFPLFSFFLRYSMGFLFHNSLASCNIPKFEAAFRKVHLVFNFGPIIINLLICFRLRCFDEVDWLSTSNNKPSYHFTIVYNFCDHESSPSSKLIGALLKNSRNFASFFCFSVFGLPLSMMVADVL